MGSHGNQDVNNCSRWRAEIFDSEKKLSSGTLQLPKAHHTFAENKRGLLRARVPDSVWTAQAVVITISNRTPF